MPIEIKELHIKVAVSPPREANEPRRRSVAGLPPEVFEESLDLLYDHAGVGLTNRSVRAKAPAVPASGSAR